MDILGFLFLGLPGHYYWQSGTDSCAAAGAITEVALD